MLEPADRMPTAPPVPLISVGASVGKVANELGQAATSAVGGSGGYVFNPEEIDQVIKQWEDLRDDLETDEREAEFVAMVQGPGREFASGTFENAAGRSGKALLEQTRRMREYVHKYIQALNDAKNATQAQDEQTADDIDKTRGMLG